MRWRFSEIPNLYVALFGASALSLSTASPAFAQKCADSTCARFVVNLKVVNGVVRAVGAAGPILRKDLLDKSAPAGVKIPAEPNLIKILLADLDNALKQQSALYMFSLNPKDQKDDAFQKTLSDSNNGCLLKSYPHDRWKDFIGCYTNKTQVKPPHGFKVIRLALSTFAGALLDDGALQAPDRSNATDSTTGQLTFYIVPSHKSWADSVNKQSAAPLPDALGTYLNSFDRGIWENNYIQELVNDFYARRGLAPGVMVTQAKFYGVSSLSITVSPNPKITLINFMPPEISDDLDRRLALYNLLSSENYKKTRALVPQNIQAPPLAYQSLSLPPALQVPDNEITFAAAAANLAALGFTATKQASEDGGSFTIQVEKNAPKGGASASTTTAAATPAGQAAVPSLAASHAAARIFSGKPGPARVIPGQRCTGDTGDTESDCASVSPPRDKKQFIGVGFEYLAGQGFHPVVAYEDERPAGPGNITCQSGSANQLSTGSMTASFDYVRFRQWDHRVTVDLNGGTDATVHRLLGLQQLDERRTGGKARAQLEVFRNPLGASLQFYGDARGQSVSFSDPKLSGIPLPATDTLVGADAGALYTFSRLNAPRPYEMRIEPAVYAGHSANSGAYARSSLTAYFHKESIGIFVFEMHAQFQQASRFTPIYELPSFGGVSSVRGYRADDLLGRRLWTAQPEIWTAIPWTGAPGSEVAKFISRYLRAAAFLDAGGAWQTVAGSSGNRLGPGAGLRLQYRGAVFRGDWAYGVNEVASGSGHGRFYFSVSTPII